MMNIERHELEALIAQLRGGSKREKRAAIAIIWLLMHARESLFDRLMGPDTETIPFSLIRAKWNEDPEYRAAYNQLGEGLNKAGKGLVSKKLTPRT